MSPARTVAGLPVFFSASLGLPETAPDEPPLEGGAGGVFQMPASQSRSRWPAARLMVTVQPLAPASEPLARVEPGASSIVNT